MLLHKNQYLHEENIVIEIYGIRKDFVCMRTCRYVGMRGMLQRIELENITGSFASLISITICFMYHSRSTFILFGWPLYGIHKWDQYVEKYPLSFANQYLLRTTPYSLGMLTTMMLIDWWTLGFEATHIRTSFISPMTFTFHLSNCMILVFHVWGFALRFLHSEYDITFEKALDSTRKMWTFRLNISKVNRNGGLCDLDLFPIKDPSSLGSPFIFSYVVLGLSSMEVFATLDVLVVLLAFTFFPLGFVFMFPTITSWKPWMCWRDSCSFSHSWVILHNLKTMIFYFIFFMSSTTSQPNFKSLKIFQDISMFVVDFLVVESFSLVLSFSEDF